MSDIAPKTLFLWTQPLSCTGAEVDSDDRGDLWCAQCMWYAPFARVAWAIGEPDDVQALADEHAAHAATRPPPESPRSSS